MGGSASKRPRPSYEDGKVRDLKIAEMQRDAARDDQDQRSGLMKLLRRTVHRPAATDA